MRQQPKTFRKRITVTLGYRYWLFLPAGYDRDKRRWPLMLFLHGMGERGDDLKLVIRHGPPKLITEGHEFPFIVISPQCPGDEVWSPIKLNALTNDVVKRYRVDRERVYVTGLSMGGHGTWYLALKYPRRFAAIAPVCGAGNPDAAHKIKHLPTWIFHGERDEVVSCERSREMARALRKCGGKPRLTIYPNVKHDSWTRTYKNPKFYDWLLKQRRRRTG